MKKNDLVSEHEKMVSISEKDWHFRLVKYVFDIDPKIYKNLCPYFWLTIASILTIWFMFPFKEVNRLVKSLKDKIISLSVKTRELSYNEYIKSLSKAQIYIIYIKSMDWTFEERRNLSFFSIPKKIFDRHTFTNIVSDYAKFHNIEYNDINDYKSEYDFKYNEYFANDRLRKKNDWGKLIIENKIKDFKKEADKIDKNKLNRVINITKFILYSIIFAGFASIIYLLSSCFVFLLTVVLQIIIENIVSFSYSLLFIASLFSFIALLIYISSKITYIYEKRKSKYVIKWYEKIYAYPFICLIKIFEFLIITIIWELICVEFMVKIIWGKIFVNIGISLFNFVTNFGGIFGEYLGASYTDYCPGIDWENKEDKNNLKK